MRLSRFLLVAGVVSFAGTLGVVRAFSEPDPKGSYILNAHVSDENRELRFQRDWLLGKVADLRLERDSLELRLHHVQVERNALWHMLQWGYQGSRLGDAPEDKLPAPGVPYPTKPVEEKP